MTTAATKLGKTLLALERKLLSPRIRHSGAALRNLLADGFVEFGSSGRVYDRESIIESLAQLDEYEEFEIEDFRLVTSTDDVAFVTFKCIARAEAGKIVRKTNRSSLWQLTDERWQMVFHQGTKIR